jgi:hypothetical protein
MPIINIDYMKKLFSVWVVMCFIIPGITYAVTYPSFHINYSGAQKVIAPQLLTTNISGSTVNDFSLHLSPNTIITSPPSSTTQQDIVFNNTGITQTSFNVTVSGNASSPVDFTSVTPSVVSVDKVTGVPTYISDGAAQVNATVSGRTKGVVSNVSHTDNQLSFYGYSPGTVAYAVNAGPNTDIVGKSPSTTTQNIYLSTNDSNKTYVRNTSILTGSLDLTAIPVYNSADGTSFAGILVAPDVILMANHMPLPNGTTVYFVDNNNVTSSRTITSGVEASTSDIYVARLNSPVATGISFAKVPPSNFWTNFFSPSFYATTSATFQLPFLVTNQFRSIGIDNFLNVFPSYVALLNQSTPSYISYLWGYAVISGDSGSPVFTSINGQLVTIGTWWQNGIYYSTSNIANYYNDTNSAITSLGSSYQLTPVDLSGFPSY